jgi:hypothetical protein
MAFIVGDQDPGTRVGETIGHLRPRPPRVQWHHHRPDRRRCEERDRPFGQIAHRQRDAVARSDAQGMQMRRQRRHRAPRRFIGYTLVFIDGEDALAMTTCGLDQVTQRRRRILPHARRDPADRHGLHLELAAGRSQTPFGFRHRHDRPVGVQGDDWFMSQGQPTPNMNFGFGLSANRMHV